MRVTVRFWKKIVSFKIVIDVENTSYGPSTMIYGIGFCVARMTHDRIPISWCTYASLAFFCVKRDKVAPNS
jgi:hypothetical protein